MSVHLPHANQLSFIWFPQNILFYQKKSKISVCPWFFEFMVTLFSFSQSWKWDSNYKPWIRVFFSIFLGLLQVSRNVAATNTANNEAFRQRIKAKKYSTISPSAREAKLESGFFKPGLVIFDKDGTLVCFHTMWSPWATELADRWVEYFSSSLGDVPILRRQNFEVSLPLTFSLPSVYIDCECPLTTR